MVKNDQVASTFIHLIKLCPPKTTNCTVPMYVCWLTRLLHVLFPRGAIYSTICTHPRNANTQLNCKPASNSNTHIMLFPLDCNKQTRKMYPAHEHIHTLDCLSPSHRCLNEATVLLVILSCPVAPMIVMAQRLTVIFAYVAWTQRYPHFCFSLFYLSLKFKYLNRQLSFQSWCKLCSASMTTPHSDQ